MARDDIFKINRHIKDDKIFLFLPCFMIDLPVKNTEKKPE